MSGTGVFVTESNVLEVDPKIAISASTQMTHKSNQLCGSLRPKMRDSLLNQGLLMSKVVFKRKQNPLNNRCLSKNSKKHNLS